MSHQWELLLPELVTRYLRGLAHLYNLQFQILVKKTATFIWMNIYLKLEMVLLIIRLGIFILSEIIKFVRSINIPC